MCICLPNGKFNFKFSRSYPCLGKKDSTKHKQNLTLIEESSEEDENHSKLPVYSNSNGVKKNGHNSIQAEYANHQGHYRQLSRDRQLPPVPDADDFHMSHPFRQSSFKQKHKSCESTNFSAKDLPRQNTEDYGTIIDSETYGESRSNAQSPFNAPQVLSFKMMPADDMKDVDPLYAIVIPQQRRAESKDDPVGVFSHGDHDSFLIQHLNDHGYSIIIKKTPLNEFSSLRKPDRSKAMSREQCHQSLQSLSNQAPGLPVRLYKESDIFHLRRNDTRRPHAAPHEPETRIRDPSKSSRCSSSSIRRFSQPLVSGGTGLHDECSGNEVDEPDVLRSLQSCFNTPPIKRASLGDLCVSTHRGMDNDALSITAEVAPISMDAQEPSREEVSDLYRRITVRESLASLRERNALPTESVPIEVTPAPLQHVRASPTHPRWLQCAFQVYEGFYETLYYSSADNSGRGGAGGAAPQHQAHQHTNHHASPEPESSPRASPRTQSPAAPHRQPSQERMVYLGLDNYLSITENPIGPHAVFPGPTLPNTVARRGSATDAAATANHRHERSSVVYTATGSDIYAEISDVYLSKQYEELPEPRQVHRSDGGGQVNNGFIECSSPGSVRVMLEIQSFRHMDSDVDISSRCTTPLHPFGKSVAVPGAARPYGSHFPDTASSSSSLMVRHPWYLPQKSGTVVPLCVSEGASTPASSSSASKAPQNSLVVMTPLMERSMEDASAFALPDDDRAHASALDFGQTVPGVAVRASDSGRAVLSSLQAARRILYPPFNCSSEAL